jgi:hypothetical protein
LSALGYTATFDENGKLTDAKYTDNSAALLAQFAEDRKKDIFEADPDAKLDLDEELDKYYDYNAAVKKAEKSLDKLSAAKERVYGESYLDALDKEIGAIDDAIDAQDELSAAISTTMKSSRATLGSKYGLKFNADGNFANYDDIVANQVNAYNNAYDTYAANMAALDRQYNTTGMSDEEYEKRQKAIEDSWEAAQKSYEDFKEATDEYSEDIDLFEQSQETL